MFDQNRIAAIVKVARSGGIEPAALLAVVEIESRGEPFEADGETPRFLFEKHIFRRQLKARAPATALARASANGLTAVSWSKANYAEQRTSEGRRAILRNAREVDVECANLSCSWGVGQIMGFNAVDLGYDSATAMVQEMSRAGGGFAAQVDAMLRFIRKKGLQQYLANRNWTAFAIRYNGAGQAKNQYDTKLAAAYGRWKTKTFPDVIFTVPDPVVNDPAPVGTVLERGQAGEAVRNLQTALTAAGFPVGKIDGDYGPLTEAAVFSFQSVSGLAATGKADERTIMKLAGTKAMPLSKERMTAKEADLLKLGSRTIAQTDLGKKLSAALGAIGAGGLLESILRGTSETGATSPLKPILDSLGTMSTSAGGDGSALGELLKTAVLLISPTHGLPLLAAGVALYLWRTHKAVSDLRVEDHTKGYNKGL